jgi:hypothetical protein
MTKVITIKEFDGIPEGSVFDAKRVTTESTVCFTSTEFAEFSKRLLRPKQ